MQQRSATPRSGTLYIVATPLGNLEDITLRALRILKEVGLVAAEDTRRTRGLLTAHGIATPLASLYDAVEARRAPALVERMLAGTDVAYVSDAGTPGVSDPGYCLVNAALEAGIPVVPIPGPSAAVMALSASGLPMDAFVFLGFLSARSAQRRKELDALKKMPQTLIFYESPQRMVSFLKDCVAVLGNRRAVLARELTKLHEEFLRGTVDEIRAALEIRPAVKGEMTLLVAGAEENVGSDIGEDEIRRRLTALQSLKELSLRDSVDVVAAETGLPRKQIYKIALNSAPRYGDNS